MKDKVILTDVDGVLLDWIFHFERWMAKYKDNPLERYVNRPEYWTCYKIHERYKLEQDVGYEYAREFNRSAEMRYLSPYIDAKKYVKKLHEECGYVFHVITSQTSNSAARKLRIQNLQEIFGNVFEEFKILETGASKAKALSAYEDSGCYWIEDKAVNVDTGIHLGLRGILMAETHNANYRGYASRVETWKDIYNIITNDMRTPNTGGPTFPIGVTL